MLHFQDGPHRSPAVSSRGLAGQVAPDSEQHESRAVANHAETSIWARHAPAAALAELKSTLVTESGDFHVSPYRGRAIDQIEHACGRTHNRAEHRVWFKGAAPPSIWCTPDTGAERSRGHARRRRTATARLTWSNIETLGKRAGPSKRNPKALGAVFRAPGPEKQAEPAPSLPPPKQQHTKINACA